MPLLSVSTPSASYQVHIGTGLLDTLGDRIRTLAGEHHRRSFVVTSTEIWRLWSSRFLAAFPPEAAPQLLLLPSGEIRKRLASVERLAEQLVRAHADRDTLLVAFGGGIVGDVTGFLAAIYMRGVPFVQVPTTLLAQVDSSVGGKTGVNLRAGKNLIGSFHHPLAVFADMELLGTLPAREFRAGLQESIKAGIIRSPELFDFLHEHREAILTDGHPGHDEALAYVITQSVAIKAAIVNADEHEADLRMILNFGHTLGHAIEAATGYKQLLHGEAIGWGMIAAAQLAERRGLLATASARRIEQLIQAYGPLPAFSASPTKLLALTSSDKKNRSGTLTFLLPSAIGSVHPVRDVAPAELLSTAASLMVSVNAASALAASKGQHAP